LDCQEHPARSFQTFPYEFLIYCGEKDAGAIALVSLVVVYGKREKQFSLLLLIGFCSRFGLQKNSIHLIFNSPVG
jgi:hypothetical protein